MNDDLVATVRRRLAALNPDQLELRDDSHRHRHHPSHGGGGHLSATIVSKQFDGLSRIARHRAVYALVSDLMPARLHALELVALTPEEFNSQDRS